jgi:hypothetical protein
VVISALLLALSTAAPPAMEVPFVSQTDALCGGASAAMVFRYWGDAHADAQQFASLVERRAGGAVGIANDRLVDAVRARGWRVERTDGSIAALRARIDARQPVVVLLAEGHDRFHYVVVVGATADAFVVHDPSWGPSRSMDISSFARRWAVSQQWSLVILPGGIKAPAKSAASGLRADACGGLVADAIEETRTRGLDHADEILGAVREKCPSSAGPMRELAGVRFAQRRWAEAAALAREAIDREPEDQFAHHVLGASLFMQEDEVGALRAWNEIGLPHLDQVNIQGLHRSRYQAVTEALGLTPPAVLTADAFLRARHRLEELPDRASARLAVRPEDDGFADVDVMIAEHAGQPRGLSEWLGTAVRAGVDREVALALPGLTGQGDLWSASWRFWANRPRVAVGYAAPRVAGLFGVWRVEGSWETETYGIGGATPRQESRAHGALTVSDWLTGHLRYSLSTGFDAWDTGQRAASAGASLERRWLDDRLSLGVDATKWLPIARSAVGPTSGFSAFGARATARSASISTSSGWGYQAVMGTERVSDAAPFTLWPGAGEGVARAPLLRAHPLLKDGVLDVLEGGDGSVFGRSLQYASAELVRWLDRPAIAKLGVAGFVDVGRAAGQAISGEAVAQTDLGAGLRLRLPGVGRALRIDLAHGLRDGANALTVGWIY